MFHKLCTLTLVAPLASALFLQIPENPTSGGQTDITWINEPNDPVTWDIGLVNGLISQAFLITNNVDPSARSLTLTLPVVPVGSGYALLAFVANDFNQNFATSSLFSIGPATSSSGSESSTASSTTSSSTTSSSMTSSPMTSSPMTSSSTTSSSTTSSSTTSSSTTSSSTTSSPMAFLSTTSSSTTSSSTTSSSTTSSPMTSSPMTSSSTTSSSMTSSSTTPSFAGSSLIPQTSSNGNGITATPSSSSTSSGGLGSGDVAALASSIPIGVLGVIFAIISALYTRKQALAGKPVLSALKDNMARFRHSISVKYTEITVKSTFHERMSPSAYHVGGC